MKKSAAILGFLAFLLLALTFTLAQSPVAAPKKDVVTKPALVDAILPSKDEVDAALKRTFGYDPSITWEIYDIRPSVMPGMPEVLVSVNKQPPSHIYLSPDRENAIIGNLIPFGSNPFAPARAKLQAADGPAKGPQTPAIYIIEFSDLQCPHCKAAQPVMEKLAADFPQVRYVFQQFPLPASMHPWALKAAEYADCVSRLSPSAFWKYIDSIFENQGSIAAATAEDKLKELAGTAGLDAAKISACAALPQTEARIKKSQD